MSNVIKVALEGINVFNSDDPNDFSLFVDNSVDYILIKESARGSITVNGTDTVAHGLSGVPFCLVFVEVSSGVWKKVYSTAIDGSGLAFTVDSTNLNFQSPSSFLFKFFIFYDRVAS